MFYILCCFTFLKNTFTPTLCNSQDIHVREVLTTNEESEALRWIAQGHKARHNTAIHQFCSPWHARSQAVFPSVRGTVCTGMARKPWECRFQGPTPPETAREVSRDLHFQSTPPPLLIFRCSNIGNSRSQGQPLANGAAWEDLLCPIHLLLSILFLLSRCQAHSLLSFIKHLLKRGCANHSSIGFLSFNRSSLKWKREGKGRKQ